jgi:hypothetical protein
MRRVPGLAGWSSILRTLLVQQEHWSCLGMLSFLQLASEAQAGPNDWEDGGGDDDGSDEAEEQWEQEGEEEEEELDEADLAQAIGAGPVGVRVWGGRQGSKWQCKWQQ